LVEIRGLKMILVYNFQPSLLEKILSSFRNRVLIEGNVRQS